MYFNSVVYIVQGKVIRIAERISLSGAFKKSIFKIPILLLNLAYWYYVNAISDTYGTFEYEFDRFLNL